MHLEICKSSYFERHFVLVFVNGLIIREEVNY